MELTPEKAHQLAQQYIGTTEPLARLGWGIGGYVFHSPDFRSAIKVHKTVEQYRTEVKAYSILRQHRVTTVCGLTIPVMRSSRDDLRAIEMDFVSAPYLLDFAGVLFHPHDYSEDAISHWQAGIRRSYGEANEWIAYAVYSALQKYGLYYMDIRPSNLNPKGHPDFDSTETDTDDEPY